MSVTLAMIRVRNRYTYYKKIGLIIPSKIGRKSEFLFANIDIMKKDINNAERVIIYKQMER